MEEKENTCPQGFWVFWWQSIREAFSESREKFGFVVDVLLWVSAFGLLVFAWYSKHHPSFDASKENEAVSYWFAIIPAGLWILWFSYHIPKAAYKIYKREAEERIADNAKAAKEIEEKTIKLIEKSASEIENNRKILAKHPLGNDLLWLGSRLHEATEISSFNFVDDVKKQEWDKTQALFGKIENHLDGLLSRAEMSLFANAMPKPLPPDNEPETMFSERRREKLWHINYIIAKKDALAGIIERLG